MTQEPLNGNWQESAERLQGSFGSHIYIYQRMPCEILHESWCHTGHQYHYEINVQILCDKLLIKYVLKSVQAGGRAGQGLVTSKGEKQFFCQMRCLSLYLFTCKLTIASCTMGFLSAV